MTDELPIVEELRKGVTFCRLHDDNSTELFDVEVASELMAEAADIIVEMAEALRWYAEQVAGCRKFSGDAARHELHTDGGKRATDVLAKAGGVMDVPATLTPEQFKALFIKNFVNPMREALTKPEPT